MNIFNSIMTVIGYPLGWIMWAAYKVVPNYLVALILFTLVAKLLMMPLSIKQQKSTAQMAVYQPKVREIQAKYANNRVKMNEEMQKLYAEEGYNPSAGCLPLLIQFPILFGLIDVIYKPLTHLLRIPGAIITEITTVGESAGVITSSLNAYMSQITAYNAVRANPSVFAAVDPTYIEKITSFDMSVFGIDLAQYPTWTMPLLIIPVLSGLTALASSLITTKTQSASMDGGARATNWTMTLLMPAMSLWFTTKVAAGVGIYWIINNILGAVQAVILNKFYNPKDMIAQVEAEKEARKELDRQRREEAHERARQRALQSGSKEIADAAAKLDPATMSEKEANRLKIAEARRRMAEKYGDAYVDVTDADLK